MYLESYREWRQKALNNNAPRVQHSRAQASYNWNKVFVVSELHNLNHLHITSNTYIRKCLCHNAIYIPTDKDLLNVWLLLLGNSVHSTAIHNVWIASTLSPSRLLCLCVLSIYIYMCGTHAKGHCCHCLCGRPFARHPPLTTSIYAHRRRLSFSSSTRI